MSACMSGTRGSGVLSSTGDMLVRAFSLPGSDHIEIEPHWFPVWSFPLEHIHLSGCLVAQFHPASTGLLHWLASGIL